MNIKKKPTTKKFQRKFFVSDIGESGIINLIKTKIAKKFQRKFFVSDIGDDCAVIEKNKRVYQIFKVSSLVEDVHFSLKWSTPRQIGIKAIESSISDIAAMGGIPEYALVSLGLPPNIETDFVNNFYDGIITTSKKYNISIIGGDITKSRKIFIGVFLIGRVEKKFLASRGNAKVGELIFCTGDVGKSKTGLELLKNNMDGKTIKIHLEAKCRLDLSRKLVSAGVKTMIDVSDGVASEIKKICDESKVGAVIYFDKLPISKITIQDAEKLKMNPIELALYGGEDFELIFTAPKSFLKNLDANINLDSNIIGEVVDKKDGCRISRKGKFGKVGKGFDHFNIK